MRARAAPLTFGLVLACGALGVNAAVGGALAARPQAALALALLPALAIVLGALVASRRPLLVLTVPALGLGSLSFFRDPLPMSRGTAVFAADLLVLFALGIWAAAWLAAKPDERPQWLRTPVLGIPFVLFAIAVFAGVLRGHERYGAPIVGQPLRLLLYAGIAAAVCSVAPRQLYRGIVLVFYGGVVVQMLLLARHLASGTSQTDAALLSTGGERPLALGTAIYLSGALVLALVNLELDERASWRGFHLTMAALAGFGVAAAFGRTNFAALGVLVPLMFLALRRMQAAVVKLLPLAVPFLLVGAILVPRAAPELVPTLQDRLLGTSRDDVNVRWREEAVAATLAGVAKEPLLGVGFGRISTFTFEGREYATAGDAHNSFAFLLAGGGTLALGTFVLLALAFLRDALRRLRCAAGPARVLIIWALSFWFVFMVNALTGPVLTDPAFLLMIWLLMLVPAAASPLPSPAGIAAAPAPRDRPSGRRLWASVRPAS